jgi:anaerobic ribonucleoside-triphosphate reductase activating protein
MRIAINKLHFPVTSLGPGRRIGIWVQGCSIGCAGCVSRDTWQTHESSLIEISTILDWCRNQAVPGPDGITISGGEPFEQPVALTALLDGLSAWRCETGLPFDVLCYSGFPFQRLQRDHADILARLDAVIPEPFIASRPSKYQWRGSANQPLIPLSKLAQDRYADLVDAELPARRDIQAQVQDGQIWFIGIPGRGDMERLEQACRLRGLIAEHVSWRA